MSFRIVVVMMMCVPAILGCHSSTQPGDNRAPANSVSILTDSLVFHRASGEAIVTTRIHNGSDSLAVFAACCEIAFRIDSLRGVDWIEGFPSWERTCIAHCPPYLILPSDSTYTKNIVLLQEAGFYRIAAIHGHVLHSGAYPDTVISNTFEVL